MRDKYQITWLEPAKQDLRDIVFYLVAKALVKANVVENSSEAEPNLASFKVSLAIDLPQFVPIMYPSPEWVRI